MLLDLEQLDRQRWNGRCPLQLAASDERRDLRGEGQLHTAFTDGGDPTGMAMAPGIGHLRGVIKAEPG